MLLAVAAAAGAVAAVGVVGGLRRLVVLGIDVENQCVHRAPLLVGFLGDPPRVRDRHAMEWKPVRAVRPGRRYTGARSYRPTGTDSPRGDAAGERQHQDGEGEEMERFA
ncbi:hypothetical protein GCM10009863_16460 [Streptomyces axinellae]|uniref:Secreted protein n=1 Tax=Streptomyces axinellae TaxID=552788 RepID=A0ABP6C6L6_9ACTN